MKTKLFLLVTVSVLVLASCDQSTPSSEVQSRNFLPQNAKVVKELGNGWFVFEVDGKKFLYRYYWAGHQTTEVLAPWVE